MRSGSLNDCFTSEEREFLFELAEVGYGEGETALELHRDDIIVDNVEDYVNLIAREQRRLVFLLELKENLMKGGETN
jgi:hypothetical protein